LFASLLFGGVILFKKYRTGENLFRIEKQDYKYFLGNGIFLALHLLTYWFAWELLDPNLAVIYGIFYMYPLVLILLAVFYFGEKFSNNRKIALGLGTIGALFACEFLPSFSTEHLNTTGILLDIAAVVTWVGYLLVGQNIMKKYKPLTIVFYDFLQVFVYVSLFQLPTVTISELNPHNLLAILYLAVVASFIAYLCYWTAVKNIGASNSGIFELATPIIGVSLAFLFLTTVPTLYQVGGLLMLVGSTYLTYREKEVVYDQ
jgi:drug/metabolite transporter (DMT)-like permease